MADNMQTQKPLRLMFVIGTRPEAIKLAPIVRLASARPDRYEAIVITTGQHREMLDQMLVQFQIQPLRDLNIMQPGQELCHVTSAALEGVYAAIKELEPDHVIVQGDTSTTFAGPPQGSPVLRIARRCSSRRRWTN